VYFGQPVSGSLSRAFGSSASRGWRKLVVPSGSLSRSTMSTSLSVICTPPAGPEMRMLMFSSASSSVSPRSVTGKRAICWPGAHSSRNWVIGT